MEHQSLLFSLEFPLDVHSVKNFKNLFLNLDISQIDTHSATSKIPFSRQSLL